ncbi:MAG: flavodoxin [Muribaculaceae bacterium]|nr:flavodoxin [Muribaculaceae bacterium]
MEKTGIFYGSETGTTEKVARRIASLLGIADKDIHNVAEARPSEVGGYDTLIFGTSTWGSGSMEEDWYDFLAGVEALDLDGKKIALFGCGDETMEDTFCSGVGEIHDRLKGTGATFIAPYDTIGYTFEHSKARPDGALEAVGLLLDEVNHPELTETRLRGWTSLIADASK